MDPEPANMELAAATGTRRIELYTEPYASAFATEREEAEFLRLRDTCRRAAALGLGVNAGHDLDLHNTPRLARELPELAEVSIGHALLCDALYLGLDAAVRAYLQATAGHDVPAPMTH
jgi:pyridoxine 5-phosphate synthase